MPSSSKHKIKPSQNCESDSQAISNTQSVQELIEDNCQDRDSPEIEIVTFEQVELNVSNRQAEGLTISNYENVRSSKRTFDATFDDNDDDDAENVEAASLAPKRKRQNVIPEAEEVCEEVREVEEVEERENADTQLSPCFYIDSDEESEAIAVRPNNPDQIGLSKSQFERDLRNHEEFGDIDIEQTLEGEPGHIQEVSLQNFMCHQNFSIKFGPRINFVIGPNGSGKSAIISAIALGLGARAVATTRSSDIKGFIKTGETRAKICIKLCNYINAANRCEAYLPDIYGKSIIVERTIYASGASVYKICNEANKVISEKKADLDFITKHFQIFVDNPICVLTQEVSKNFLNSKNPKDKFKFFVKATQLEEVKNCYESANTNKDNTIDQMKGKKEEINHMKQKLQKEQEKIKIIELIKNSVQQLNDLSKEGVWAMCHEKKMEIKKIKKQLAGSEDELTDGNKKIDFENQSISELKSKKQEFIDRLQNYESYIEECRSDFEQANSKQEKARSVLVIKERNLQQCKVQYSALCKDIFDLEKRIDGMETQSDGTQAIDIGAEMERVNADIAAIHRAESESRQKLSILSARKEELRHEKDSIMAEESRQRALINSHMAEIQRFNRVRLNHLDRYGNGNFPELVKAVDCAVKESRFRKRPYGPLGAYCNLQDKSAAFAAETLLKGRLSAFVVDNYDDMRTLKTICKEVMGTRFKHPEIIVREYCPLHDVSRFEVRFRFYNFLQILSISQPEVANCLIDHSRIERILYIPSYEEAQNLLIEADTTPHNCIQAYTQNGDLIYPQTNSTDYKCYPNRRSAIAKILINDSSNAIEEYRQAIKACDEKILLCRAKAQELTKQADEDKKEFDRIQHTRNRRQIDLHQKERELSDLKKKSKMTPVEVIVLREDILKKREEKAKFDEEIKALTEERNAVHRTFIECAEDVIAKEKATIDAAHSRRPINAQIDKLNDDIKRKVLTIAEYRKNCKELSAKCEDIRRDLRKQEEVLCENINIALEKTGTEIETVRKYADIRDEMQHIQMIIERNPTMMDQQNQNEIIQNYQKLRQDIDRASCDMKKLVQYINLLSSSIEDRKTAYFNLRHFVHVMVNYFFEFVLRQKGFRGHIDVDFVDVKNENNDSDDNGDDDDGDDEDGGRAVRKRKARVPTLNIVIFPRDKKQFESSNQSANGNGDDDDDDNEKETSGPKADTIYGSTRSLSGGERSYSTVAFIIALWQINASPFRLLDEVDVFMDLVTRKISIDMLVTFATKRSSKQFIFLSPLRLQQIGHPECVRIFQMPEIVRR